MSIGELLIYAGIYFGLMAIGFMVIRRNRGPQSEIDSVIFPANENLEAPKLGTGLGPKRAVNSYGRDTGRRAS